MQAMVSGDLNAADVAELLAWAGADQSGALVFESGGREKGLYFDRGRVVGASSSDPHEYLSHQLLAWGLLSAQEIADACDAAHAEGRLLGSYLVRHGLVVPRDLARALSQKTREATFDVLEWNEGRFRFEDRERLRASAPWDTAFEVTALVEEGRRRRAQWRRLNSIFPSAGRGIPVAIGFLDDGALEPDERAVLREVNDHRTVQEIANRARTGVFEACCILMTRIERGRLKIVAPPNPHRESSSGLGMSTGIPVVDSDNLIQVAERCLESGDLARAQRYAVAARTLMPPTGELTERVAHVEESLESALEEAGVIDRAVPVLLKPPSDFPQLDLSVEEEFLAQRVDGRSSVDALLRRMPTPPMDSRLLIHGLARRGIVRLVAPASGS